MTSLDNYENILKNTTDNIKKLNDFLKKENYNSNEKLIFTNLLNKFSNFIGENSKKMNEIEQIVKNYDENNKKIVDCSNNEYSSNSTSESINSFHRPSPAFYDISQLFNNYEEVKENNTQKKNQKTKYQRTNYSKEINGILKGWLLNNADNPYPTEEIKKSLSFKTKLNMCQINNWFVNARRRILPKIKQKK